MKNIFFITNIPSPYRVNFYNELTKYFNVSVLFEALKLKVTKFNYLNERNFLFGYKFIHKNNYNQISFRFNYFPFIYKNKDSIFILSNYSSVNNLLVRIFLQLIKAKYYYELDGAIIRKESFLLSSYKKFMLSGAIGFFSPSNKTDLYIKKYISSPQIYRYPFTSLFINDIGSYKYSSINSIANREKCLRLIFVGQIIPRKGVDVLLKAINLLPINTKFQLSIIGGTPTKNLDDLISVNNFKNNINFIKYLSKTELDNYYLNSDIFILPTREDVWGLVVNEALAKGLPVITTNKAGAGLELIKDGFNGFIFPSEDYLKLSSIILNIINHPEILPDLKKNALSSIKEFTIENMALIHKKVLISKGD
jgi:glycosyltransferase involved in cell wall biosynthesis